ncbi:aminopeptidase Q [Hemicordylus capensis]|uniref:aminopeptidase Q n=1 Tax=Hemicordylus capensis TaxID=884348 RepID=UPI0023020DE8|nr:aminopeptidase Q [Hemicordylus capensis]
MGSKSRSGFYLGKKTARLLALLLLALLLALLVLGILYGRCVRQLEDEKARTEAPTPTPPASASPPGRPPGPWDHPRLPSHVEPLHYSLLLWPHMAPGLPEPRTHSGQVNITVRCRQDTPTVLWHSAALTYQSAVVVGPLDQPQGAGANRSLARSSNSSSVPVAELWEATLNQYAVLELRENLSAGALYELQLAFQGSIQGGPRFSGLFLSTYEDEGEKRTLIASQLQPIDARTVYPCFDEPAMKATFNISIVHHPSYVALSNMPAIDVSEYKDVNESTLSVLHNWTIPKNWTITTFETTPKMSSYLTVFVVCNFDYVTTTERGNEIRIWSQKDNIRNGFADYALNITGRIFSYMEDLLNISYSLSKTDLIALPNLGAGAMENWGLMTFQENSLLYRPQDKFTDRKIDIRQVVSHEIGHQWFGNLVTMDWWNDLWLNEGFASYFEYLGANYIETRESMDKVFISNVLLPTLDIDDGKIPQSLSVIKEKAETDRFTGAFDMLTYHKGASIVRMLCSFVTEKLFTKALNSYLNAFSFLTAVQDDLWHHVQKVVDKQHDVQLPAPVKVIMDTWTCQYGFPVLTVNLSTGNIKQEQFYDTRNNITKTSNNTWIVPISWMRNATVQPLIWLDKRSKIFPEMKISNSEHDWIILNVNVTGYYRINYDQLHWRRLAKVLESDPKVIPAVNRLQLIVDAFELRRSGYTEYDTPMLLTKYLEKEDDNSVWNVVLTELNASYWRFILSDYELYPVLKKYFLPRISTIYRYYADLLRQDSFEIFAVEYTVKASIDRILRTACWFGLQDCLDLASEIFAKWMDNPNYEVPFCISDAICCYAIQVGSEKEWDFAWKMYNLNDSRTEDKYAIFTALSCTREPWLLRRFLQYFLNDSISASAFITISEVIEEVAKTEVGHWIAWIFVRDNWSSLYDRFGVDPLNALITTIRTDLEVQMIQPLLNNTLEPHQILATNDRLMAVQSRHEEKKESLIQMIKWLRKNIDV